MNELSNESNQNFEYFKERFLFVSQSGIVLTFLSIIYITLVYLYVTTMEIPNTYIMVFVGFWLVASLCAFFFLFIWSTNKSVPFGQTEYIQFAEKRSNIFLFINISLLMINITIPIILIGGSQQSVFGSILSASCGLIVVLTESKRLRIGFAIAWFIAYILFSFVYVKCNIADVNKDKFKLINSIISILTFMLVFFLSWSSKTFFRNKRAVALSGNIKETK